MTGSLKRAAFTMVVVATPVVVIALLEGLASLALTGRMLVTSRVAEEGHTEHDTLLGWVNLPNVSREDFYGPGLGLHTNAQRFRHAGDVAPRAAPGRFRIVCSGDSFTLGYGVDDTETWCQQLEARNPALETINMGQGGYGLDQAYLWYLRDGLPLRPDLHVFALVTMDFYRLGPRFLGYAKPQLAVEGDSVRVVGVPVPRPGLGRYYVRTARAIQRLSLATVANGLFPKRATEQPPIHQYWAVSRGALRDLTRRNAALGVNTVVVLLPLEREYDRSGSPGGVDGWRQRLHEAADQHEYTLIDLVEPFRRLPRDSVQMMFIQPGTLPFHGAAGHLTAMGNAWVAAELSRRIASLGATPVSVPKRLPPADRPQRTSAS